METDKEFTGKRKNEEGLAHSHFDLKIRREKESQNP